MYIGLNTPKPNQSFEVKAQTFSGNGSNQTFTLNLPVNKTEDIEVLVSNVQKSPFDGSYTVSGTTLTITTPPGAATNNVVVIYRSYYQVSPVLNNQTLLTQYYADASVTSAKLANSAVTTGKVADTISMGNVTHAGNTLLIGNTVSTGIVTLNTRASQANHATQKSYVDALTIIFGA